METGTVGSGKKTIQDVLPSNNVGVICVTTLQTTEPIPLGSVSPLGMTTCRTSLAGISRRYRSEHNTVVFTSPLDPVQPVTICPCTERSSHTYSQETFDSCLEIHVLQLLYYKKPKVSIRAENLLGYLVHALPQAASLGPLPLTPMLTSLDRLENTPNVFAKKATIRSGGHDPHPRVKPQTYSLSPFRTRLDLKSKLYTVRRDNVRLLPFPSGCQKIVMLVELDGKIDPHSVTNGSQNQPRVETHTIARLKARDGAAHTHPVASMRRLYSLLPPPLTRSLAHVHGLPGRDLAKPRRKPCVLRDVYNRLQKLSLFRYPRFPEVLYEDVAHPAILGEYLAKLGLFRARGKPQSTLAGSLDLHIPVWLAQLHRGVKQEILGARTRRFT